MTWTGGYARVVGKEYGVQGRPGGGGPKVYICLCVYMDLQQVSVTANTCVMEWRRGFHIHALLAWAERAAGV